MDQSLNRFTSTGHEDGMETNYEREWTLEFHGIIFEIILAANEALLCLDIEQIDSGERWSGQFTSQYLEELTHQVGNYKKYNVFIKMLMSGLSGESENVYVNLLTYNDLQLLKARKLGVSSSFSSQTSQSHHSQSKRYIILTYASEFDRVNFPLPLTYEDNPSVPALQKTIKRLRSKLKEVQSVHHTPKERELIAIDSNLRQENTELKHRLRQLESRIGSPSSEGVTNQKLRKQVESLKRDLSSLSETYEKLKIDSAREISKWRSQTIQPAGHDDYKMKYISIQHILESERIEHRKEVKKLLREIRESKSFQRSSRSPGPAQTRTGRKVSTQTMTSSRLSSGLSTVDSTKNSFRSSSGFNSSQRPGRVSPSPESRRSGRDNRRRKDISTAHSPTYASLSRSRSPASSLGRRFDPTAYALERAKKAEMSRRSRAWGSARGTRYSESGYSSANSQSSNGSRRSARSNSSSSVHSRSTRNTNRSDTIDADLEVTKRRKRTKKRETDKGKSENRERALPNKYSHRMENRVETNTQRELSQMDSLLLTSGNLKTIEIASQHQSLSNSWPDPTFHPTKPPLHQNQTSHLDEIESSESEHEVQVRSRGELALSSVESSSDSEGGMIIPSKPSIHLRSHEEVNSNLHPKSSSDLDAPRNPERESEPELPDKSNINRESDIDQRISTLRKFINKTRNTMKLDETEIS